MIQILANACSLTCPGLGDIVNTVVGPIFRLFSFNPIGRIGPIFLFCLPDHPHCVAAMPQILAASPRNYIHIF